MSKLQRCVLLIAIIFVAFPLHPFPTELGFALQTKSGTPRVTPPVASTDEADFSQMTQPGVLHEIIGDLGYEEYPSGNDHISHQKGKWTSCSKVFWEGTCYVPRRVYWFWLYTCNMFQIRLTISNTTICVVSTWMKQWGNEKGFVVLPLPPAEGDEIGIMISCHPVKKVFFLAHASEGFLSASYWNFGHIWGIDRILRFLPALFDGFPMI